MDICSTNHIRYSAKGFILTGKNYLMKERIYLVGFMGVGKTTVGKKLARQLGYHFVDLDDFFEEKFKIEIHQFFNKYDEPLFRKLEHNRLEKTFEMEGVVVATGGGTPCHHHGIEEINRHGLSVFLEMPPPAIAQRLLHARRQRPLVTGKTGKVLTQFIKEKLEERQACYEMANLQVNALNIDIAKLADKIKRWGSGAAIL